MCTIIKIKYRQTVLFIGYVFVMYKRHVMFGHVKVKFSHVKVESAKVNCTLGKRESSEL